jgi:hypothetical protein
VTILSLRRRAAAALALASMVLNAAWPMLANARPQVPAQPSEICSATGLIHADGDRPAAPRGNLHASHCVLCPLGFHGAAAIPDGVRPLLPSAPVAVAVVARDESPRPQSAFHPAAPPRAPPFLS